MTKITDVDAQMILTIPGIDPLVLTPCTTDTLDLNPPRPRCPGCKQEIDPDCCCCGDTIVDGQSHSDHTPVPQGCVCGYVKDEPI